MTDVQLRAVTADDVPILFAQQADEEAARMASFRPRDHDAFVAHWARIAEDPTMIARVVVADGEVAGNVGSWDDEEVRLVGYWIGREHWGRGIATAALRSFLEVDLRRPLHALVAVDNVGSIRVLEKCGFEPTDEDLTSGDDVAELVYRLGA
jgi:RimJ/RimL family protein N-acetyltransferase